MSPDSLYTLGDRIRANETLASLYNWNFNKRFGSPLPCDKGCRTRVYCDVTSSEYFQKKLCNGEPSYDWFSDPKNAIMNFMLNTWIKKE